MIYIVIMAIFIVSFGILAVLAGIFAVRLDRAFRRFRIRKMYTAAIEAPSVSICIPARNETHAMTQCLERVLASDYKKLEVIVYDDGSSDDTSVLIRSFAHAGVRFVAGDKLPTGWLGRNHALDVLAREASGTYIVFLDVDTAISPSTISWLVGYAMTEKVDMVSVLPRRNDTWRVSVLFGPLRYFWELILSRASSPAAAGSLWLIARHTLLETLGGMTSYKNDVMPEASMAARLTSEKYHCLIGNEALGVSYEKRWSSQVETSRRLLYPMAGNNWLSGIFALLGLALLNVPFFVMLSGFITGWTSIHMTALVFVCVFALFYVTFTRHTWQSRWWLGALVWPIVIFQELVLLVQSMLGYAQGTITWKGRPVVEVAAADLSESRR